MTRPLTLRASEVRELLERGRCEARRPVKPQPEPGTDCPYHVGEGAQRVARRSPFGRPGDRFWVRETWAARSGADRMSPSQISPERVGLEPIWYQADGLCPAYENQARGRWRSPIAMPRWASRLDLETQSVRVEQVDGVWEWAATLKRIMK